MLTPLFNNPVFFIALIGLLLFLLIIIRMERFHKTYNNVDAEKPNPVYQILEHAEQRNCRLKFCQSDCYMEFGEMLECNIHNVGKEWVHVTYPINTEDDIHKIIRLDKINAVELIDDMES